VPKAEILRNRFGATAECNSLSSFTVPFGRQFVLNTAHRGGEIAAFSIGLQIAFAPTRGETPELRRRRSPTDADVAGTVAT